ncbi:MAG: hypothetical protein AB1598_06120 [Thermodesulfobacteriota bacterium]
MKGDTPILSFPLAWGKEIKRKDEIAAVAILNDPEINPETSSGRRSGHDSGQAPGPLPSCGGRGNFLVGPRSRMESLNTLCVCAIENYEKSGIIKSDFQEGEK